MKIARTTFGFVLIMILAFSAIPVGMMQPASATFTTNDSKLATLSYSIFAEDMPNINITDIRGEILGVGLLPDGSPAVALAEIGLDISGFNFENPEYEGFLGAAVINIHGTLLAKLLMKLMGNETIGNETMGDMPQEIGQLINLLTNSLIIVYMNVTKAQGESRSSTVASSFSHTLGISIQHAKDLYISIEGTPLFIGIYAIRSTFTQVASGILNTFPTPGLSTNFNMDDYSQSSDSVAVMLIARFKEQTLSVGALGYLREQAVQGYGNHTLDIAEVAGMSELVPSTTAKSFVGAVIFDGNITGTDYPTYSMFEDHFAVFNLTDYGSAVSSYKIYFEGKYPPLITLRRVITPQTVNSGGTVSVTVIVTNNGTEPVTNVMLDESEVLGLGNYTSVELIGNSTDLVKHVTTLNPGESFTISYQLHFTTEGTFILNSPILRYEYSGDTYYKWTPLQQITVQPNLPGLVQSAIQDYMPYSLIPFGLIGLALVFNIKSWIAK